MTVDIVPLELTVGEHIQVNALLQKSPTRELHGILRLAGGQIYRNVAPGETLRNAAHQCCGVTHLVIETEVITRDQVDPNSLLFLPMASVIEPFQNASVARLSSRFSPIRG